ncbi:MAG TPA: nucleoside deaminase [Veillonellaceae bacterium]|nr:nucleoside deaminase [Veillonellaceae bacterium]
MDDAKYMDLAIKEGLKGLATGEVPIGAVLTLDDLVIAIGHNTKETMNDPSGHAEIQVIKSASKFLSRWRLTGCTLYVTIEPCPMCAGAIMGSRISRLVYGAPNMQYSGINSTFQIGQSQALNHNLSITAGVRFNECKELMDKFFLLSRERH